MNNSEVLERFDRTTSRWGRITMLCGIVVSLLGPAYLYLFTDLDIQFDQVWKAYLAVAATFGIIWVTEPLTFYPMLGAASTYQAFMIGNISNKLLPAALAAQDATDSEPGTKRGELVSVAAICGAALVHLLSLLIFVGFLGTWLISVIPEQLLDLARSYILPVVMGAVMVQAIFTSKHKRVALIAWAATALFILFIAPLLVKLAILFTFITTPLAVISACIAAWAFRPRRQNIEA